MTVTTIAYGNKVTASEYIYLEKCDLVTHLSTQQQSFTTVIENRIQRLN